MSLMVRMTCHLHADYQGDALCACHLLVSDPVIHLRDVSSLCTPMGLQRCHSDHWPLACALE